MIFHAYGSHILDGSAPNPHHSAKACEENLRLDRCFYVNETLAGDISGIDKKFPTNCIVIAIIPFYSFHYELLGLRRPHISLSENWTALAGVRKNGLLDELLSF